MKRSMKAAILSGLVFPGAGHIYLKRYTFGIPLLLAAASAAYYIISIVLKTAEKVSEQLQAGNVPLDMPTLSNLVSQQMGTAEQSANMAVNILIVLWVAGIADSYRQGLASEKDERETL